MINLSKSLKKLELVILAGGFGTRISEVSHLKPKPMIEIGNKPIIWHIMKYYSKFGINNFIICLGYKGKIIQKYFENKTFKKISKIDSNWNITFANTGIKTMTGGRLKLASKYIRGENFCLTYGDGLSNINIRKEYKFHLNHGKLATIAAVKPPGRFGSLLIKKNSSKVMKFIEKPLGDNSWINGGFFILNKKVIKRIRNKKTIWEESPLKSLSKSNQLVAYKHNGFWQPMDTLRDKNYLEKVWKNKPPWKVW